MEQAHKKRPPRATANSPPVLSDMGEFYFINLANLFIKYTLVNCHLTYHALHPGFNLLITKIEGLY